MKFEKKGADKMIYIAALILGVLFVWVIIVAGIMGATADAREAEKRLNAASLDLCREVSR